MPNSVSMTLKFSDEWLTKKNEQEKNEAHW
jgi:hypothetical protein